MTKRIFAGATMNAAILAEMNSAAACDLADHDHALRVEAGWSATRDRLRRGRPLRE